jgi:hypothetical protein
MIVNSLPGNAGTFRYTVNARTVALLHERFCCGLYQALVAVGVCNLGWLLVHGLP